MSLRGFLNFFLTGLLLLAATPAAAWGPEGHRIIGNTALTMLEPEALSAVHEILGSDDPLAVSKAVAEACSWPDAVRETPLWEWSAPLHYVNIPRSSRHYERERDCPDGMCVTAGIQRYANELSRYEYSEERRWQAFAFLCHLVGDLHQPLHAGYRDDRGANQVIVQFRGESANLHQFWDRMMPRAFLGEKDRWSNPFDGPRWTTPLTGWSPYETMVWTDESHTLVADFAYPPEPVIGEKFAVKSWLVAREQWQKAANRLALILNTVLVDSE